MLMPVVTFLAFWTFPAWLKVHLPENEVSPWNHAGSDTTEIRPYGQTVAWFGKLRNREWVFCLPSLLPTSRASRLHSTCLLHPGHAYQLQDQICATDCAIRLLLLTYLTQMHFNCIAFTSAQLVRILRRLWTCTWSMFTDWGCSILRKGNLLMAREESINVLISQV